MKGLRKNRLVLVLCILCIGLLLVACGKTESGKTEQQGSASQEEQKPQEKYELRFVSAFPKNAAEHFGFWLFYDEVEKRLGDRLTIKYLGGEEVVGYFEQWEMCGKGVFEVGHLPGNMAKNFLPIAETLHLSQIKPWEERENGAYDILRKGFEEKMNLIYLGKTAGEGYKYVYYTNFKVDSLADFKGKTMRVAPIFVPHLTALGAGSVAMPAGEVYTAMERGVVDGFGWPVLGPMDYGWYEVTKYRIDPGFYPTGLAIVINADAWYKLPEDIRTELEEIAKDVEKDCYTKMAALVEKETKGILEKGMEIIQLPEDVAAEYLKMAYDAGWAEVIKNDPENGPKLRELTSPK